MKNKLHILLSCFLLTTMACSKNEAPMTLTDPPRLNTAPKAFSGDDTFVFSPDNFVTLQGTAEDKEYHHVSFQWKKIKGPASADIENPSVFKTKVSNLEPGEYEFELTALDNPGLSGSDTVKVKVLAKPLKEIFASSLEGGCPFGCYYRVKTDTPLPLNYKVY